MNWLEIIEIRSSKNSKTKLKMQLKGLINEINSKAQNLVIRIYSLATIDTDFSIHLLHDSKEIEKDGSSIGLHLVSALKEFGLVSHSVWMEMENKK